MTLLHRDETTYPANLSFVLGRNAPIRLHCLGNLDLLNRPGVGFCGSRKASELGLATAKDCAQQAAEMGLNVISGNAAGVDGEAHFHALANGGTTILVLPEGIEHFRIKKHLSPVWDWSRVLVISQFQPSEPWQAYRAMARNRVIIGLSGAMIVIEAGDKGGTLNAGKSAIEMGIPLFVARYESVLPDAKGNEILIKLGGTPLAKSRATMRANMPKVKAAVDTPQSYFAQNRLI